MNIEGTLIRIEGCSSVQIKCNTPGHAKDTKASRTFFCVLRMLRTAARSRGASLVSQYDKKVSAGALIKDTTQREALRRLERLRQELLAHGSAMVEYQHAVCHAGLEPRAGLLLTGLLLTRSASPWTGHSVERQRGCHHARAGEAGAGGNRSAGGHALVVARRGLPR